MSDQLSAVSNQLQSCIAEAASLQEEDVKGFRDLKVWGKAHQLTLQVYKASVSFPRGEMYGLTSQIRRAAASIPANIAEGCGRNSDAELGRFLQIAMGSASELEYYLLLARDLSLLAEEENGQLALEVTEVKRMLASFINKLNADS
jgi:four helix bundle protein